jgi:hypothetical protein
MYVLPVAALILPVSPPAFAESQEAGRYRFEAFMPGAEDPGLPAELRVHADRSAPRSPALLAVDRAVEVEWVGREGPDLREYRLTATIDGGPLSGFAARWTVASGSGEPVRGRRSYRLRLPLPVDGRLRLHAALEAVREDGSVVLLAVRDSTPAPGKAESWLGEPARYAPSAARPGGSAVLPLAGAALFPRLDAWSPEASAQASPGERCTALSADASRPGRPRGPPPSAA